MNHIDNHQRPVTYTARTANIKQLVKGDKIYVSKIERGFQRIYLCSFEQQKRNIIHAIVEETGEFCKLKPGDKISTWCNRCFQWGVAEQDTFNRCLWYRKNGVAS